MADRLGPVAPGLQTDIRQLHVPRAKPADDTYPQTPGTTKADNSQLTQHFFHTRLSFFICNSAPRGLETAHRREFV